MNSVHLKGIRENLKGKSSIEWDTISHLTFKVQKDFQELKHLSIQTYHEILEWKLGMQESKLKKIKDFCSEELIVSITRCYNEIKHPDIDMETRIKVYILLGIPWIGINIVSTIMTFHKPEIYGVLDAHAWLSLYNKEKKSLDAKDYIKYLNDLNTVAEDIGCNPQGVSFIFSQGSRE